jgi:GNAT superfamily N-acetyltransferase
VSIRRFSRPHADAGRIGTWKKESSITMGDEEIRPVQLTGEMVDEIVFGMENQEVDFYFDLQEGGLIPEGELPEEGGERYVEIPEWRPVDGFRLMERFVATVKNPLYRDELRAALNGGRGVFRRFKDILKQYEPLERLWYNYKDREMRHIVLEWYSRITEAQELAKLGEEPVENEQLILSDFTVRELSGETEFTADELRRAVEEAYAEYAPALREHMYNTLRSRLDPEAIVFSVETPEGERVGSLAARVYENVVGAVMSITYLYVEQQFRGLGLSKVLIDKCVETANREEVAELMCELPGKTFFMEKEFLQRGFREFKRHYSLRATNFE